MKIRLLREPTEQQQKFIDASAKEQCFGGAKRGGKSVALCIKIILLSFFFPGNRILLARRDFTDLWDTTLNEFKLTCPPELYNTKYGNGTGWNKGDREIQLKTRKDGVYSSIIYRGLGEATSKDVDKSKSLTLGALAVDEASETPFETWKMLNSQLQWVLPDGTRPPYMSLITTNPEPGWVKERYKENPVAGSVFIPSLPRDNPHLPPGWEQGLRDTYDAEWVEKYLDGSWDVAEGSTFPELDVRIHDCSDWIMDFSNMKHYSALDHGSTGTTACVYVAIDSNFNRYVYDEIYEEGKLVDYCADAIKKKDVLYFGEGSPTLSSPDKPVRLEYRLIDPSTFARTQQGSGGLESIANLYIKHGINVIAAHNWLEAGIQTLKMAMHVNPQHIHPFVTAPNGNLVLGAPHLYINRRRCPNTWKEFRDHRKEILPSGQVRYVGKDHAMDGVRYIENSQPKIPILAPKDKLMVPLQQQFFSASHDRWVKKWANKSNNKDWWKGIANK